MITGDYDQLRDMADNNVCAADNGRLVAAWHKERQCYYLKCGICGETKAIQRSKTPTEELQSSTDVPAPAPEKTRQEVTKRAARSPQSPTAMTLGGIPATDLGTGELLKLEVLKALVDYAYRYGLDPTRGHVCLMYGKPYFTIDGYLYHANRTGKIYTLASRPLTAGEVTDYQIPEAAHAWLGTVTFPGAGNFFTGLGIVTWEEMEERSKKNPEKLASPVVARHPWQLAQKRCEWQALRRAFPIGESEQEVDNGQGEG